MRNFGVTHPIVIHNMKLYTAILTIALAFAAASIPAAHAAKPKARVQKAAVNPNEQIPLAEKAFYEYRFEDAANHLDEYETLRGKIKKNPPAPIDYSELKQRIDLGLSMLDRVEKIAIIDSLTVNADDFFRAYRLSAPSGRIQSAAILPADFSAADTTSVYVTENGSTMIWADVDDDGNARLVESTLLADGSWETPTPIGDDLRNGADANFPFLMSDGMTLYYASNGDGSLGGYDIFITRNNGDQYLQPQNIGMPYNSPYNDYLLAIDELTGAGWWATDRNHIPGKLTIYIFVPQELRINYPVDDPELTDRARVTSIAATWPEGSDYSSLRNAIAAISNTSAPSRTDGEFSFAMPGGKVYTSMRQFRSRAAANGMREYIMAQRELQRIETELATMRQAYAKGNKSLGSAILKAEDSLERQRTAIRRIANSVIQAETKQAQQ